MNKEKTTLWITIGYIICIIVIVASIITMEYRKKTGEPTFVDFTTVQSIETAPEKYAFLKVEALTKEVSIDEKGDNSDNSKKNKYYIAMNSGYMYIVNLNSDVIDSLKAIQEYTYSQDENAKEPEPVTIYGKIETIPTELRKAALNFYNKSVGEQYAITEEDFEMYFGSVLLNTRNTSPVNTIFEKIIVISAVVAIIIIFIAHISKLAVNRKTKK